MKQYNINVLSLFDGMSCGYEALTRAGIKIDKYLASEIDKYAIEISKKNHPDIWHIGSVTNISFGGGTLFSNYIPQFDIKIDLLIGGSPCQDLSIAKKDGKGLAGEKSSLFFEYVRLLNETKPTYFLLENVASMKKADRDEISRILGVEPVMINSSLVSAQNRKRLYWVGKWNGTKYETVDIPQPEDKGILLRDILEDIPLDDPKWKPLDEKYIMNLSQSNQCLFERNTIGKLRQGYEYFTPEAKVGSVTVAHSDNRRLIVKAKSSCLSATYKKIGPRDDFEKSNRTVIVGMALRNRGEGKQPEFNGTEKANSLTTVQTDSLVSDGYFWRKLTPIECERLQTLNDGYTEGVSNSQRYKMIGNGWTVDVLSHIFSHLKNELQA